MRNTEDQMETLRLKFETWAKREELNLTRSHKNSDDYAFPAAQSAWKACLHFAPVAAASQPHAWKPETP